MKIALGTVQFGLDYGISNKQGQTCVQQASDILEYAHQNEVNFLDTATSYGNSEEMLGRIKCTQDWNIVTKTPNFNTQSIVSLDVENLRESFEQSLVKLKRKNIYGLLVHDSDDLFKPGGGKLFREMDSIRSSGRVSKIGVSVYNSEQIYKILGDSYKVYRLRNDGLLDEEIDFSFNCVAINIKNLIFYKNEGFFFQSPV